MKYEQALMQHI